MNSNDFQKMVREDIDWIKRTVGFSGTSWSLLEKSFSVDKYQQWVTYNQDSLITWITGGNFSKDNQPDQVDGWSWNLPNFIDYSNLIDISQRQHRQLLADSVPEAYLLKWNERNVYDFLYANLVNHPGRTVADIGAGYGRNSFLFVEHGFNYICIDGIEVSYMVQHYVLNKLFPNRVVDYLENRKLTQSDIATLLESEEPVIIHLPTWRLDLVPNDYVDVSLFAVSLDEMPVTTARFCLDSVLRFSADQGVIYFRGHSLRRINYLHLKAFALFNELYQVLDLEKIFPDDSPGDTYLFRFDKRSPKKKFSRWLALWIYYAIHNFLDAYYRLRDKAPSKG